MRLFARIMLLIEILLPFGIMGQQVIMPVLGHGDTTMSYVVLYDDGGASSPYSNTCNASYTFHTVNPTGHYKIEVYSYLTHPQGNARLTIGNGITGGSDICNYPYGTYGLYYSSGNCVTVCFTADDDAPTDGFMVILCEYDNTVPYAVAGEFLDSNTLQLSWQESDTNVVWRLEYAVVCEDVDAESYLDTGAADTIFLSSPLYVVPNIPVGCHVIYRISDTSHLSAPCHREIVSASGDYSEPTVCPCVIPTSVTVNATAEGDSLLIEWTCDTVVDYWHLWNSVYTLDTILSGNVMSLTIPYNFPCYGDILYINGNCHSYCLFYTTLLPQGGCHQTAGSINRVNVTGSTVTISWAEVSSPESLYLLYYRRDGQSSIDDVLLDTLPYDSTTYTVTGLQPHTRYIFTVMVLCEGVELSCNPSQATISTTIDNCIDFINFNDFSRVHLTCGTYANPMLYNVSSSGRHVVMLDTGMYDQHTGGALRCIPSGEEVSLRLGDDNIGAMAETITYEYDVDSLDKDMLVLEYAVVLQNPNHNSSNQPHFSMEILDENGIIIDTNCCYADFYAGNHVGWNTVDGSNIIWKDWTTVGIDIAPYHGQRIKIRFTTKDCADGGHFGYAYFTIRCDSKRIALVNLCESGDSVRLRVPLGFEYQWTHGDDTTVISTLNEIIVAADSTVYHCHASFIGKPDCSFTVNSLAVLPVPYAAMHYSFDTCKLKLMLYSDCRIDIDETLLPYVRQTIDSVVWVVNDDTLSGDTVIVQLDGNGDYNVLLSCRLSDSFCGDSTTASIPVAFFHTATIVGDTVACYGDTVVLTARMRPVDTLGMMWDNGSQDSVRLLTVTTDTSVFLVADYLFCSDTIWHNISVYNHTSDTVEFHTCLESVDTMGIHATESGIYSVVFQNLYGCDSLVALDLTINPSYFDTTFASACDESFTSNEFAEDSTGFFIHRYTTIYGCDSLYCLDFLRHPVFIDTIEEEILFGDTYVGYGFHESATGFYERVYTDIVGCDSIYRLNLNVLGLRFPNAVTPNGDGINDIFVIVNLLESTVFDYTYLVIYNRWGNVVYQKENIKEMSDFWNPDETGSPDGTYFYRFHGRTLSHEINHKGFVEVLRTHD